MNEINVRIKHKYDTYANWLTSEIVLEAGELAIAEIPTSQQEFPEPPGSTVLTPPAIGIKVGNGSDVFKHLPWIQSTAGDVYAWAKESKKPRYTAEEIEGLEDYISGKVEDTNTSYQFAYENDTLYIYELNLGQEVPSEATWELPITVSTKVDKVEAVEDIEGNIVELTADGNIRNSERKLDEFLSKIEAEQDYVSLTTYSEMEETVSGINESLGTTIEDVEKLITSVGILTGDGEGSLNALKELIIGEDVPDNLNSIRELLDYINSGDENTTGLVQLIETVNEISSDLEYVRDTTIPELSSKIQSNETNISKLQDRTSSVEEVLGDGTSGLVKSVSDNTDKISEIEEQVSDISNAVQTVSILGMTEDDGAVTKVGTNVEINKIPVNILTNVEGFTLIFNCGSATEVI